MDLRNRIRMAAESILENEALREGLDDPAASSLIDWGLARAQQIAGLTADIQDESEAEQASYPRMRALRRMLRIVARLSAENIDTTESDALLEELTDLIPLVYGEGTVIPETSQWSNLLALESGSQEKIIALRNLIENDPSIRKGD
jgi:hypothetical protein